jgi:hypothetical protein
MNAAPSSGADVAAVIANYRLATGRRRRRGRLGSERGAGAGSSQELFDFRDYAPGDDLRHVDWRGLARTGQLRVRLFEAEVAPFCDVVVDTSRSMAVTPAKAAASRALLAALCGIAAAESSTCRVHTLGGGLTPPEAITFDGDEVGPRPPAAPLRPGGVRVLLTDGLWPASPAPLVHTLAAGAAWCCCVQLLDPWETAPTVGDLLHLVDCETGERVERRLDRATVAAYQERLQRVTEELRNAVTGCGGVFARVLADAPATMFARDLWPAGVVEPA